MADDGGHWHHSSGLRRLDALVQVSVRWHGHRWWARPHHYIARSMPHAVVVTVHAGGYRWRPSGGRWTTVSPGQTMVIPSLVQHEIDCPEGARVTTFHLEFCFIGGVDLLTFCELPAVLPAACEEAIEALASTMPRPDEGDGIAVLARRLKAAYGLFDLIVAHARAHHPWRSLHEDLARLGPALRAIEAGEGPPPPRDELARLVGLSASQFHRLFRRVLGCSPGRHARRCRLQRALAMLVRSDRKVGEVAAAVGYDDPFLFSRSFKAFFGFPPSAAGEHLRMP